MLFHSDAVQAAGHLPIDVQAMHDLLSLSAHKFHGPKGSRCAVRQTGDSIGEHHLWGSPRAGRRAGTENIPAICGAAAAFDEACAHMEKKRGISDAPPRPSDCRIDRDSPRYSMATHIVGYRGTNVCFEGLKGSRCCCYWMPRGLQHPPAAPVPPAP